MKNKFKVELSTNLQLKDEIEKKQFQKKNKKKNMS
jgi:hypothetical protein